MNTKAANGFLAASVIAAIAFVLYRQKSDAANTATVKRGISQTNATQFFPAVQTVPQSTVAQPAKPRGVIVAEATPRKVGGASSVAGQRPQGYRVPFNNYLSALAARTAPLRVDYTPSGYAELATKG